ncbi:MAG TPA: septal ring lytic transglycosylase RlpA family protein, partial [Xanthomonadaceae bacterium]|nr:septal ring lytic transglycosylase RlpA family protein [Xanthomonadaceae bacterium]
RALGRLSAAGIAGATLSDIQSGGRTMWRLRVRSAQPDFTELAGRIARLGFGMPKLVRE